MLAGRVRLLSDGLDRPSWRASPHPQGDLRAATVRRAHARPTTTTEDHPMNLTKAFRSLQTVADADPDAVRVARQRRSLFRTALASEGDIPGVVYSGSLQRRTQRDPLNDVDVIAVYDAAAHPDWGLPGESAAAALDHAREQIHRLLGTIDGTYGQVVRLAKPRNHAVKCFLDDPDNPDGFTVDVMPALRQPDGALLVPERLSDDWILTNPEHLIAEVARRQAGWDLFVPLVRVLKCWNDAHGKLMKSLTMEVFAIGTLAARPAAPLALQQFFASAVHQIDDPIQDPTGLCGEIQPDLDHDAMRELFDDAAGDAWHAVSLQADGKTDAAACRWRQVFGDAFPEPDGGCPVPDTGNGLAGFYIGTGITEAGAAAGAAAVTIERPSKVIDAPSG
jgi:hypothetical protein